MPSQHPHREGRHSQGVFQSLQNQQIKAGGAFQLLSIASVHDLLEQLSASVHNPHHLLRPNDLPPLQERAACKVKLGV